MNNESLLKSMPFIKDKSLKTYTSCKATQLLCSKNILNKLSKYNQVKAQPCTQLCNSQIWDPVHSKYVTCQQSCTDQTNSVQTTMSDYPAKPTFPHSSEFCMLVVKFVDQCKDEYKRTSLEEEGYRSICSMIEKVKVPMRDVVLRQVFCVHQL